MNTENNNYWAYRNEQWILKKSYFKVINKENSSASNTKSKASNYIRNFFSTVSFMSEGFHLI